MNKQFFLRLGLVLVILASCLFNSVDAKGAQLEAIRAKTISNSISKLQSNGQYYATRFHMIFDKLDSLKKDIAKLTDDKEANKLIDARLNKLIDAKIKIFKN